MKNYLKTAAYKLTAMVFLLVLVAPPLMGHGKAFVILKNRSIDILSSQGDAVTTHTFSFKLANPTPVSSVLFQYCTDPIDDVACDAPNGVDVSAASFDSQSGETGFSMASTSANTILLTRPLSTAGQSQNSYVFSNVKNPSDIGPFFVRISLYPTADASGPYNAFSSVAASINQTININSEVPQILYFCSALSIPTDCSNASGDFIDLGILTSTDVHYGTSQFLVGTNAPNGYAVSTNGPTMTSGTDQINAMTIAGPSQIGKNQFGINLRANLSPLLGAEMNGGSGSVAPAYSVPNQFHYTDGDTVALGTGPTTIGIYTVSYIVNVKQNQAAGIYNTTITYVCTAGF
jgi:hypothetical protein